MHSNTIQWCETKVAMQALEICRKHIQGRELIVMVDNEPAQASLVKGWSHDPDCQVLVEATWTILLKTMQWIWIERVPSKANPADGPSRAQMWNKFNGKKVITLTSDL